MPRFWAPDPPKVFRPATVRIVAVREGYFRGERVENLCKPFLQADPLYQWCDMVASRRQFLETNGLHDRFAAQPASDTEVTFPWRELR